MDYCDPWAGLQRLTLLALVHSHAQSDPRHMKTMRLTRPSVPLDRDGSKEYINALLLVSTLIATVTFAAGFTIPGGFRSSTPHLGMAALATDPRLIFFLLLDMMAMQSSVLAVVSLIWAQLGDPALVQRSLNVAWPSLYFALHCMVFAFFFGMVIAVGHLIWLIVVIYLITILFLGATVFIISPHMFLQSPGIPALWGHHLISFVTFADDEGDESYQSSTQRSVKRVESVEISSNDHVEMPDTT